VYLYVNIRRVWGEDCPLVSQVAVKYPNALSYCQVFGLWLSPYCYNCCRHKTTQIALLVAVN
jgi:hypothetical protein